VERGGGGEPSVLEGGCTECMDMCTPFYPIHRQIDIDVLFGCCATSKGKELHSCKSTSAVVDQGNR